MPDTRDRDLDSYSDAELAELARVTSSIGTYRAVMAEQTRRDHARRNGGRE